MIYDIGFQRYRDYKFRVCGKDSIPFVLDIKIYFRFCVITKPLIVSSRLRDRKRKKYIKYLNQSQENDVLE